MPSATRSLMLTLLNAIPEYFFAFASCLSDGVEMMTQQPPKSLTDLPNEILEQIVSCFDNELQAANGDPQWPRKGPDSSWRQDLLIRGPAIRHLRLTCRRLNELASPKLAPALRIRLDPASLDAATNLIKNPLIASGILKATIGLGHFREEVALRRPLFKTYMIAILTDLYQFKYLGRPLRPEELQGNERCVANYCRMRDVLENSVKMEDAAAAQEYRSLMTDLFVRFYEKHMEQKDLRSNGKFATAVATIIAQLPTVKFVELTDAVDPFYFPFHRTEIFTQNSWLSRYVLNVPFHPAEASHMSVECTAMVRFAASIPVAIKAAGVDLKFLSISCFPRVISTESRARYFGHPTPQEIQRWKHALGSLEGLQLQQFTHRHDGKWLLHGKESNYLSGFIEAATSGLNTGVNVEPGPVYDLDSYVI